jgi:hypothetical protein
LTRFDLSEVRDLPVAKRTQRFHWLLRAVLGSGVVAMGLWVAILVVKNGWTAIEAVTVGIEVVASILWVCIFIMTGPGANCLEIRADGIELGFARGRTWRRAWDDRRFALNVFQTQNPPDDASKVQWIEFGSGLWPVTNFLTPAAFDALLRGAEEHGMGVGARPAARRDWTWYRLTQSPS